jgi:hypothetical protein
MGRCDHKNEFCDVTNTLTPGVVRRSPIHVVTWSTLCNSVSLVLIWDSQLSVSHCCMLLQMFQAAIPKHGRDSSIQ